MSTIEKSILDLFNVNMFFNHGLIAYYILLVVIIYPLLINMKNYRDYLYKETYSMQLVSSIVICLVGTLLYFIQMGSWDMLVAGIITTMAVFFIQFFLGQWIYSKKDGIYKNPHSVSMVIVIIIGMITGIFFKNILIILIGGAVIVIQAFIIHPHIEEGYEKHLE